MVGWELLDEGKNGATCEEWSRRRGNTKNGGSKSTESMGLNIKLDV